MPDDSTPQKQGGTSKQKPEVKPDTKKPDNKSKPDAKPNNDTKSKENSGQRAYFDFPRGI
jgi:hypothetical protein